MNTATVFLGAGTFVIALAGALSLATVLGGTYLVAHEAGKASEGQRKASNRDTTEAAKKN